MATSNDTAGIRLSDYDCRMTENHPCSRLSKNIANINKIFKFFVTLMLVVSTILVITHGPQFKASILKSVITHYGMVQTTLVTMMGIGAVVKMVEGAQKISKNYSAKGALKEKALPTISAVTSTAIAVTDIAGAFCAAGALIGMFTGSFSFTSINVIIGVTPIVAVVKGVLKGMEYSFDRMQGKADKHKITTALSGVAAMIAMSLAIAKIAGAVLSPAWLLSFSGIAATIGLYEALKAFELDKEEANDAKEYAKFRQQVIAAANDERAKKIAEDHAQALRELRNAG